MKIRFVPLTVLLLLGLTTLVQAQDPERGQLYEVSIIKVDPGSLMTFIENVTMVKAAAEAANLPARFGWQTWMRDFEIGFVGTIPNMAWLDDDQAFMAAFAGTPGEELVAQAMEKWEAIVERFTLCVTESRSSGMQHLTDASYAPFGG